MTPSKEDLIAMAQQVRAEGFAPVTIHPEVRRLCELAFAAGAAAERERIIAANAPEIERVNAYIAALEQAVAAEREACAKVCDDIFRHWLQTDPEEKLATPDADDCARAIRARGETSSRGQA